MCNYIETISGRKIDFYNPDPDQIVIEDIVHALRNTCRFGGFINTFYSVMQHSDNVALLVPDKFKYQAILHDAAEAYIGDMPTPFKYAMKDFLEWHAPTPRRSWYRPSEERLCWAPTRSQFLCLQIRIRFSLTVLRQL